MPKGRGLSGIPRVNPGLCAWRSMSTEVTAEVPAEQAWIQATVIRCTCDGSSHVGEPCPTGRLVPLGTISYYHKNPIRRWAWAVKNRLKELRNGHARR